MTPDIDKKTLKPMQQLRLALQSTNGEKFTAMDFKHIPCIWKNLENLVGTGELKEYQRIGNARRVFSTTDKLRDPMTCRQGKQPGSSKSAINDRKRKQRLAGLIPEEVINGDNLTGLRAAFPQLFTAPKRDELHSVY